MECYAAEPLASDSADKKRIKKAIKESKQLREEKQKAAAARWKPKKSPCNNEELMGQNMWWLKKAITIEWRECRPTWHVTLNSCVFVAVETAITPGTAVHQSQARMGPEQWAIIWKLKENVHNHGYLEFENVDFGCSMVMKGRLKENISF